jgi:hypothetical protein
MLGAFNFAFGQEARERVFDLPQDENKWFISVVGDRDGAHYQMILSWFDENEDLAEMKSQVHFHAIATDSAAYRDRYQHNTTDLPMIRVQKADGYVVHEVSGGTVPDTDSALLTELGLATMQAGGPVFNRDGRIFPIFPIFRRPLLPYRHRLEEYLEDQQNDDCDDCPAPAPIVRPKPKPPAKPKDKGVPGGIVAVLALLGAGAGGIGGALKKWKALTESSK